MEEQGPFFDLPGIMCGEEEGLLSSVSYETLGSRGAIQLPFLAAGDGSTLLLP